MDNSNIELTLEDFRNIQLRKILEQSKKKDCSDYNSLFITKAKDAENTGDEKAHLVYRILADISSMSLRSDNYKEPFGPMIVMDGGRSAIVDDFSESQLAILRKLVEEIDDPELRARIADVLWIRKRDHKMAETAIDSYIESASILEDPRHWLDCYHRIERAFRLAVSLGEQTGKLDKVIKHIEEILDKYHGDDPLFLSEKLMALLCERKVGDPQKYGKLSEIAAKKAEQENDLHRAQSYWMRKADWDRIGENKEEQKRALINAAETYVNLADLSVSGKQPSYMAANSHITKAIEAYRRIGGMKERVSELHQILLEYQQKSVEEFGVIKSGPINLSEVVEEARKSVKGKNINEALIAFSTGFRIESFSELKKRVKESTKNFPLQYLMSGVIVNKKGKVIGKKSSLPLGEKIENEELLRPHIFQQVKYSYSIEVQALIEPMRRQIELEHYITIEDINPIVINNQLIPQHREYLYAKGLFTGLQGDFIDAIHILVPQFENSVRYLLEQRGITTSGINDNGIQEEYDLNKLLYMDETKKIFGEDMIFHLQGLLVEKSGCNIRNRMAHGLMYPGEFYSPDCIYLWALIFRLCCWPLIIKANKGEKEDDEKKSDKT